MLSCVTPPAPEDAAPPTTPTLETVEPSATPAPRPEFTVVDLVETHTDVETVDTAEFPADNCQGRQLFAVHMTASHPTTDQVTLEGTFSPDVVELVRTTLEEAYGAVIDEQTERTVEFWREVEPGSFLQHPDAEGRRADAKQHKNDRTVLHR